ncbi:translation initiation factor IF-3 [Gemmata sp.]|uniref:translation initiation factor IF-3 n=1 Tax=Gemmata sp. TaxID=1914242 RepID=UPI003F71EE9A
MNEQIRISPIRLIGAEGEQHGIVPTSQALEMARESGLDLVEVADKERPPVCKIMDYGKFKYAQSKKSHQKTHQQKLKEIRVRPKTGDHDIDTKVAQARKFLDHSDKVQVNVLFRGREMQHIEEGQRVMNQLLEALQEHCKIESPARMEGKRMVALLAPKPGGAAKPAAKPKADKPEAKPGDKPEAKPADRADKPAASANGAPPAPAAPVAKAEPAPPAAVAPAPAAAPVAAPAAAPAPAKAPAPKAPAAKPNG